MKTRWKFLREGMKSANGDCVWVKGKWKHEDTLNMCHSGFHCSKKINDAFSYVQGEILAKVKVRGKLESQNDKECWTDMSIIQAWKWQKKDSVALAIYAAELCIENFEKLHPDDKRPRLAIEAAKFWIDNPTSAAASAADSAADSAYSAAASAAARAAARAAASAADSAYSAAASAAARAAARAAASAAARAASAAASAARKEICDEIFTWMELRVKELEVL